MALEKFLLGLESPVESDLELFHATQGFTQSLFLSFRLMKVTVELLSRIEFRMSWQTHILTRRGIDEFIVSFARHGVFMKMNLEEVSKPSPVRFILSAVELGAKREELLFDGLDLARAALESCMESQFQVGLQLGISPEQGIGFDRRGPLRMKRNALELRRTQGPCCWRQKIGFEIGALKHAPTRRRVEQRSRRFPRDQTQYE